MEIDAKFTDLSNRLSVLTQVIDGLASQLGTLEPAVHTMRTETVERFAQLNEMNQSIAARLDALNAQVWGLRDDLPAILDQAFRRAPPQPGRGH